jgi:hypothetical protein
VKENKAVVCHEGRQRIWQWGLALARSVVRERIRTLLVVHRSRQLSGIIIGEGIAAPTGTEGLPFCAHNASAPRFAVPAWAIVRFSDPGKSQISPCFRRWYRNNRCRLRVLNINLDVKRSIWRNFTLSPPSLDFATIIRWMMMTLISFPHQLQPAALFSDNQVISTYVTNFPVCVFISARLATVRGLECS